jgi:hypothetical protein
LRSQFRHRPGDRSQLGAFKQDQIVRSMRLFAEEVMPAFR